MKALFFHAVAGHPDVAPALATQARATLRPFQRFLGQAIHTAKQRQVRYQLPWERVQDQVTVRLEPQDTLLRVPRRPPDMLLAPWPADVEAEPRGVHRVLGPFVERAPCSQEIAELLHRVLAVRHRARVAP